MMNVHKFDLLLTLLILSLVNSFTPLAPNYSKIAVTATSLLASKLDDIISPQYDIESLPIRVGHGFDIHRMAPLEVAGQPIIIGGVTIDHNDEMVRNNVHKRNHFVDRYSGMTKTYRIIEIGACNNIQLTISPFPDNIKWTDVDGLYVEKGKEYKTQLGVVAHSDGDVIYHSIVDAIFGALTLPDIGQVFQDTDPRWKDVDSSKFMEYALEVMIKYGYKIGNIDVTLILERPKVATFKPEMKENIVRLLKTNPGQINIKARTHERVDSVGELRSLSCHVVLTLVHDSSQGIEIAYCKSKS